MQPQSPEKIAQLATQFPYIGKLLDERSVNKANKAEINVTVKRADHDFLFMLGVQYDGANGSMIHTGKSPLKGTKRDFLYFIGHDGDLVWKWEYDVRRDDEAHLVVEIIGNVSRSQDFMAKVAYCIWVEAYNWFTPPTKGQVQDGIYFGRYRSTDLRIVVYQEPELGWEQLMASANLHQNVTLSTSMLLRGSQQEYNKRVDRYRGFISVSNNLQVLATAFQEEVYFKGLKEIIDQTEMRGMSGQFVDVKVLIYVLAGRIMFTLSDGTNDFSIVGAEDETDSTMGYSGINATYPAARNMVRTVIEYWAKTPPDSRNRLFVDDEDVHLLGL